jgi:hypothetical protein
MMDDSKRVLARTPSYCNTSSRVVIYPFQFIEDHDYGYAEILMKELLGIKYAHQIAKFDCGKFFTINDVLKDIENKQSELKQIYDCESSNLVFQYFYYQEPFSATPEVKVTSDGIDAAISVTFGGKELDGVSVNWKVQGAEVKNFEMKNSGYVYMVQVSDLAPEEYDLEFVITGEKSKVKGGFKKVKCCFNTYSQRYTELDVYGSDGFTYVGNFTRTEKRSVKVGSSGLPAPQTPRKTNVTEPPAPSPRPPAPTPQPPQP